MNMNAVVGEIQHLTRPKLNVRGVTVDVEVGEHCCLLYTSDAADE